MTDERVITDAKGEAIQPEPQQIKQPEVPQQTDQTTEATIQAGYVIALKDDGTFHFEILGEQPSISTLLGLHRLATGKMEQVAEEHAAGINTVKLAQRIDVLSQQVNQIARTGDVAVNLIAQVNAKLSSK
jgi:hypothetical protein